MQTGPIFEDGGDRPLRRDGIPSVAVVDGSEDRSKVIVDFDFLGLKIGRFVTEIEILFPDVSTFLQFGGQHLFEFTLLLGLVVKFLSIIVVAARILLDTDLAIECF